MRRARGGDKQLDEKKSSFWRQTSSEYIDFSEISARLCCDHCIVLSVTGIIDRSGSKPHFISIFSHSDHQLVFIFCPIFFNPLLESWVPAHLFSGPRQSSDLLEDADQFWLVLSPLGRPRSPSAVV
jgi:hypothetical protein